MRVWYPPPRGRKHSSTSAWGLKREKKQIPRLPPCGIARDDNGGDELNSIEDVLAFALLTEPLSSRIPAGVRDLLLGKETEFRRQETESRSQA